MQQHPAELAHAWLTQARDDLSAAEALFSSERYAAACFMSQQAAEKALKGLLHLVRGDFVRTHLIAALLDELALVDAPLANDLRGATALDPFYATARYPDAIGGAIPAASFHRAEATLALERARHVLEHVAQRIPRPG